MNEEKVVDTYKEGILKQIGQNIRSQRRLADISQKELAQKTETTNQTISAWENGKEKPSSYSIFLICKALHVEFSKIYPPLDEIPEK